jgi:PilZ domain
VFNSRGAVLNCTVQDLSDIGARICFTEAVELTPEFELEIPSRKLRLPARLIWSREASHGVMFLEKAKAGTVPPAGWPRTSEKPVT